MTSEERDLITGLFERLRSADTQPRDSEADSLIQQAVAQQPGSPYLFVQTLLVQEHALANAQARIQELQRQVAAAAPPAKAAPAHAGGFLAGLFGSAGASIPPQSLPAPTNVPYPTTVNMPPSAGGGFLRSALSTAAGVAGGAMLFQGIESLLGHRSGAFGSGLGGGGFMDTGFGGRPEVIEETNNYYETAPANNAGDSGVSAEDMALGDDLGYTDPGSDSGGDYSGDTGSSGDYSGDDGNTV